MKPAAHNCYEYNIYQKNQRQFEAGHDQQGSLF